MTGGQILSFSIKTRHRRSQCLLGGIFVHLFHRSIAKQHHTIFLEDFTASTAFGFFKSLTIHKHKRIIITIETMCLDAGKHTKHI